jgi:hypothetical protein
MGDQIFQLLFLGIPFVCLTIMYIVLTMSNKNSTGEIKFILPPEILLKVFAVFMIITVVFILAMNKILNESTVAALIGAIASGMLGISFSKKGKDDKET